MIEADKATRLSPFSIYNEVIEREEDSLVNENIKPEYNDEWSEDEKVNDIIESTEDKDVNESFECTDHVDEETEEMEEAEDSDREKNTKIKVETELPDGDTRAWLNLLACFVINLSIQTITLFVDMGIHDPILINDLDLDENEAQNINSYFKSMVDVYAPIAVFVMTKFGYRTTVSAGSFIVCISFTCLSFLDSGSGLGVSLLKLCALIPVLECFTKKRLEALLIAKLGLVFGSVVDMSVKFAEGLDWKTLYRINVGVCTLPFLFAFLKKNIYVRPKEKDVKDGRNKDEISKNNDSVQCCRRFDFSSVLKSKKLWAIAGVYSVFRFGLYSGQPPTPGKLITPPPFSSSPPPEKVQLPQRISIGVQVPELRGKGRVVRSPRIFPLPPTDDVRSPRIFPLPPTDDVEPLDFYKN